MPQHRKQSVFKYPLTEILGSTAHVRTLRALYEHGGELSAPSIVRRTRLAKASVASALRVLEKLSVIRQIGSGRSILYCAEMRYPLAPMLSKLFEAEKKRSEAIFDTLKKTALQFDALAVWLYGSAARGEDTPSSDVDIAIIMNTGAEAKIREKLRDKITQIGDEFCFLASATILDEADVWRLYSEADPWWLGIVEDAQVIAGSRPEKFAARIAKDTPARRKRRK